MKTFTIIIITALITGSVAWLTLREPSSVTATEVDRKPIYYQSAMHPWIKSDQPGRCTICGMELTPVYPGEKGLDPAGNHDVVVLTQNQIQVLHVQTSAAKQQPLVRTLRISGTIDDNAMSHRVLAAYVDGRIDELHVNYIGAEVTEGQPLADLYSPALLQAEREYRQLNGELRKNTALRLRQMGLNASQIEALDQKPADSLSSQILAPIGGTVVSQSVYEGQYVETGMSLFEIADFSTMWFMFRAYEQDMPWIKIGQSVNVTTPSRPGKTYPGKVTFIDPNFDEATRSTKVRVELPNPMVDGRRELLHRLYADGEVELDSPDVLTIPRSAVIETGTEAVVYVDLGGGAYEHRILQTGRRGNTHLEILSGLTEGDLVVTNGNLLIDGQAEMNRSFMTPPETVNTGEPTALNAEQTLAITGFLKIADAMSAALAADDLTAFNTASAPAMRTTGAMVEQLKPIAKNLEALNEARHFHGFQNLQNARAAFHAFSMAASAVLEPLRKTHGMPDFEIYECGMVNEAISGAPKKGRWIQASGRSMTNPFFGREMSECGERIKP